MTEEPKPDYAKIETQILDRHRAMIEAHLEKDVAFFVQDLSEDYLFLTRGEIEKPSKEEILARFKDYLPNTTFTAYDDLREPIVGYSKDGSVAWSIVHVRVAGTRKQDDGSKVDFDSTWAWLTLYERDGDTWKRLLEVSNSR